MFPKLPAPFDGIDGELIANRLVWGGVVADLPPEPRIQALIQTDNWATAQALQKTLINGTQLLDHVLLAQPNLSLEDREKLIRTIAAQVEGNRLVLCLDDLLADLPRISAILSPSVDKARQASRRMERINNFKQIALAILNYESANGHFPPRATYSEDGKPLLS